MTNTVLDNIRNYDFDLVSFYVTFTQFIDRKLYENKPSNSLIFSNNKSLYKAFNISKNKFYRLLKLAYESGLVDIEKGLDNRNIYILNDHVPMEPLTKLRSWADRTKVDNENENIGCPKSVEPVGPKRENRLGQNGPTYNISNSINNSNINKSISQSNNKTTDRKTENNLDIENFNNILDKCELKELNPRRRDAVLQALKQLYFSKGNLKIGNSHIPSNLVRRDLEKLNSLIIEHALAKFEKASREKEIKNVVGYLKICIYNSISEMDIEVDAKLNYLYV
ncbi:MAG: hypothetical protein FH753_15955 [Firmicutes bacterium]|nr:hypothetical protein [Bacillota bacterium]